MASRSLGSLTVDLIAKSGLWKAGMTEAERAADKMSRETRRKMKKLQEDIDAAATKIGIALTAAFVGVAASVRSSIKDMLELSTAAQKVNMPVAQFTAYGAAAKQADVSVSDFSRSISGFSRRLVEAKRGGGSAKWLESMGIDPNSIKNSEDGLKRIADVFSKYQDGPEKVAAARALLGRSGESMIGWLNQGSAEIERQAQHMRDLGLAIDENGAAKLQEYDLMMKEFKATSEGLRRQLALALLPAITAIAKSFAEDLGPATDDSKESITGWADAITEKIVAAANIMNSGVFVIARGFELVGKTAAASVAQWRAVFRGDFGGAKAVLTEWMADLKKINDQVLAFDTKRVKLPKVTGSGRVIPDRVLPDLPTPGESIKEQKQDLDKLKSTYDQLARASDRYARSMILITEDGRVKQSYADAVEQLEKLKNAYLAAGGSADEANKLMERGIQGLQEKLTFDLEKPLREITAYRQALDQQIVSLKNANAIRLQSMTLSDREAANLSQLAQVSEQAAKAIADFVMAHQLHPEAMSDEVYESELKALREYWAAYKAEVERSQKEITAMQENFGAGLSKGLAEYIDNARSLFDHGRDFAERFAGGLEDALVSVAKGTATLKDAFRSLLADMAAQAMKFAANQMVAQFFGMFSGGGGGGGFLSSLFGSRASGGLVSAGGLYRVNERGPEVLSVGNSDYLMMGSKPGKVTPNAAGGGETKIRLINIDNNQNYADFLGSDPAEQVLLAWADRNGGFFKQLVAG